MNYLFDTSAIVHYLKLSQVYSLIKEDLAPFEKENIALLSIVSLGELKSLAKRNLWGFKKMAQLNDLLSKCIVVPISLDIVEKYSEIDTYSQGKHESLNLNSSARNMGKNDIWIAATASVINARLITTDKDFSHLANNFLDLVLLSIKGKYLNPDHHI